MSDGRADAERRIRAAWDAGDFDAAATVAIREFGPEILGVLSALLRSESEANDVFSQFCEDFWKGLPGFAWRCQVRVWAYRLARNAAMRHLRAPHRRRNNNVPLSQHGPLERLVQDIRTTTGAHLRTENKSRVRELRRQLPATDQELLILRVDKAMAWRDIAIVTSDTDGKHAELLDREAARLRKQFQLAKGKLRRLAEEAGLI